MFTMTPQARDVVREVTSHPALAATSGLRIARRGADPETPLQVGAATGPETGDEVVERDGARIFVGPGAVTRLRGRVLDAVTERSGRVHFVLKAPR